MCVGYSNTCDSIAMERLLGRLSGGCAVVCVAMPVFSLSCCRQKWQVCESCVGVTDGVYACCVRRATGVSAEDGLKLRGQGWLKAFFPVQRAWAARSERRR